ncbi:MAG: N-acetyl-gamma-glutamyl-phosphate reductase [bacterium]|nr:N-acetyl-gamma-glutamyl-phosphate reductase [bacterium]
MGEKKFNIGITGASSLMGGALIRILLHHPCIHLVHISSEHHENELIGPYFKILNEKLGNKKFDKYSPAYIKKNLDLVFIAKPLSQSMKCVRELYNDRLKIIDLSGDFGTTDKRIYEKWHHVKHTMPELLKTRVYGLPELHGDEIKKAGFVANAGSFSTGIILSLYPLLKKNIIHPDLIFINSYSGVSAMGKKSLPGTNLFPDAFNNIMAYGIGSHPHIPETEEQLSLILKKKVIINLIPHFTSVSNGIFHTIFLKLKAKTPGDGIAQIYERTYSGCRFIKIFRGEPPQLKGVVNTNHCILFPKINEETRTLNVFCAMDERIKGGAGQAVQNMNLMLGLSEHTGLDFL